MEGREILGLVEEISLLNSEVEEQVTARIDSGAMTSSLDKTIVEKLNLGPILRTKVIKSASGVEERPIIAARVRIKGKIMEEEFTVADRNHMTYQVLMGQNILKKGEFLIDPLR